MKRLGLYFLLSFLTLPAVALEWKTKEISVKAAPLQKIAETSFDFTNTGAKVVTILGIDTSCDCTEATPSSQTIAPRATGRINAKFTLGDRQGVFDRFIMVTTDEAKEPVTLRVQLDVPELAVLTPRSVEWKVNSPAWEKAVDIQVTEGLELTVTNVLPTSGLFNHRLETIEPGRHYRLHLSPQSTKEPTNAAFRVYARTKDGRDVVVSAYGNVR
ncbi:MAG TPA: DUF1573 domain-containing protein [Lacunisphaera sp.]|nr:DUF1573 domain-containing protein [Lacunisphaera sp.]